MNAVVLWMNIKRIDGVSYFSRCGRPEFSLHGEPYDCWEEFRVFPNRHKTVLRAQHTAAHCAKALPVFSDQHCTHRPYMLGGRQRVGAIDFDWSLFALGCGQYRRKTAGVGMYDQATRSFEFSIHARELSIVEAGLGCAQRWIWEHGDKFVGRTVHELGSGVGLPGIMAAAFAEEVTLSDYIPQIVDNVRYNIQLNANIDAEEDTIVNCALGSCKSSALRQNISRAQAMMLDWDNMDDLNKLTPVDIILGSELTYSPLSVDGLLRVIHSVLKRDGWFLEVLSEDRDGVELFVERAVASGLNVDIVPVPTHLYGRFGTRQRPEKYRLYTLTFPTDGLPRVRGEIRSTEAPALQETSVRQMEADAVCARRRITRADRRRQECVARSSAIISPPPEMENALAAMSALLAVEE